MNGTKGSKPQAPSRRATASPNSQLGDSLSSPLTMTAARGGRFGVWSLMLLWSLMFGFWSLAFPTSAADTLNWNTNKNEVSADIKSTGLLTVLEKIATVTRWHVFVEPETLHTVSAKFSNLPPGDALRMLLGDVNFALVPATTNTAARLYVFRTSRQHATQLVTPAQGETAKKSKPIPNELIVRLKPGAKIDDLARLLGAKVIGRIDGLNAYRLQFDDAAATDTAREQLASNPDVASVDSNFSIDPPPAPSPLASSSVPPPQLTLKPPPDKGRVIVGMIDTAVQPLGNGLDKFILSPISEMGDAQLDPNSPSHGTSMEGTILSKVSAMTSGSSSVQILPVDVYGPNPTTSTFSIAQGLADAVNKGANVINISSGGDVDSTFLNGVIQDALSKNIIIFASAGNSPVTTPVYPAAYEGVNSVTALVDPTHLASYANRGSWIDEGAPGTSVIYFNNQPWSVMGTSPAAAFASGMAAGYMDANQATPAAGQAYVRKNLGITIPQNQ